MRQRSLGLEWIDKNDCLQQRWAHEYLQGKGRIKQERRVLTHEYLLGVGKSLEESDAGQGLLGKMKNAWRQKKYRSPDKGRKACTFKLKTGVKKELSSLAMRNRTSETNLLSTLISDESQAQAGLKEELKQANDRHKAQLIAHRERINKYKQTHKTVMDMLKVSVAELCRFEIQLQDRARLIQPISEDQQRRIDKRCMQIMADAEAIVKGKSTLLPGELINHATPAGGSTQASKETATESPLCSKNSPAENQSDLTDHTFRVESESPPLQQDHLEPSLAVVAELYGPGVNNHAGLRQEAFPDEKSPDSLVVDVLSLESPSAPQSLLSSEIATDITIKSEKINLKRKNRYLIRTPR